MSEKEQTEGNTSPIKKRGSFPLQRGVSTKFIVQQMFRGEWDDSRYTYNDVRSAKLEEQDRKARSDRPTRVIKRIEEEC